MAKSKEKKHHGSNADRERFSIPRINLYIFLVAILMIVVGYWALSRPPWSSWMSLNVAPVLLVLGYCVIIPLAILYKKKENNKPKEQTETAPPPAETKV
jgi:membrane protein YdbS with pleckstrin-like domain